MEKSPLSAKGFQKLKKRGRDMEVHLKKTKEEIFDQSIMKNIRRKSAYIDSVWTHNDVPMLTWIDINITELCNRKCEFCPRQNVSVYPNQNLNMEVSLCKKIADELKGYEYKGGLIFSGNSEPLLHPKIINIISTLGDKVHMELVTNGDKLEIKLIKELFKAGLDVILISMYDGPYQVGHFKEMFSSAGIGQEHYILRDRWYSIEEDYGVKLTNRAGAAVNGNQDKVDNKRSCYYMHYCLQLDWNGDVLLCAQDFNKKIKHGNVYVQSLLDIWVSGNMTKYRKILGRGHRVLYPCENCNVNGTLHGYNHAGAWEHFYSRKR